MLENQIKIRRSKIIASTIAGSICFEKAQLLESLIIATDRLKKIPKNAAFEEKILKQEWLKVWQTYPISNRYSHTDEQRKFFNFGYEMGIWDDNYNLMPLAQEVLEQKIRPQEYLDVVILNYVVECNGKSYNPLICLLQYLVAKNDDGKLIKNETLKKALEKIMGPTFDNESNKKRDLQLLFKETSYFKFQETKINVSSLQVDAQELLQQCNFKYHEQPLNKILTELQSQEAKSYYLTTKIDAKEFVEFEKKLISTNQLNQQFRQKIYYGAPGTGKSYLLDQEAEKYFFTSNYARVTFHSEYTYADLIGTYKPIPKDNQNDVITYQYVPGPLVKLLIKALINPEQNFLLIIEEINRANAAAVFGDFFQLLDRDQDFKSQYAIVASEDLMKYFKTCFDNLKLSSNQLLNVTKHLRSDYGQIVLPSNFYIWATMNSADQGVVPIDTAFKRRWELKYIDIDFNEEKIKDKYWFTIGEAQIQWNDFRKIINEHLSTDKFKINEDKLMGAYFLSKTTLEQFANQPGELAKIVQNKVLMYLYDDVVKLYRYNFFAQNQAQTFAKLCQNFQQKGIEVFNSELKEKLSAKLIFETKPTIDQE